MAHCIMTVSTVKTHQSIHMTYPIDTTDSLFIIVCALGHYGTGSSCSPCAVASYADKLAMTECNNCTVTSHTTKQTASSDANQCGKDFSKKISLLHVLQDCSIYCSWSESNFVLGHCPCT